MSATVYGRTCAWTTIPGPCRRSLLSWNLVRSSRTASRAIEHYYTVSLASVPNKFSADVQILYLIPYRYIESILAVTWIWSGLDSLREASFRLKISTLMLPGRITS